MEPMKLNIQMFAPDGATISINLQFKDIVESELPESLIFSFDGEQVTIPISGVSMNYVWNYWDSHTFNSITILSEGYLIIPYQAGNGIVDIDIYKNFSFVKKILEDNTINQTTPDFSQVATTDEGMFADFDNEGVTTYFRGAVTNNYVKFANFWWRIIRVNGNGSVRLIYDGTMAHANGESSTDRRIGTSAFNTNIDDNAYVGYMYGTPGSTTYEATHANVNDSSIKTTLDNWYESNLSNYSDYIDTEAGFCGDRTSYSGTGTGTSRTYYGAYNRVVNNKQPTFECSNSSDLYTTSGSSQGNKALQYPIGLITADEVAYAGGVYATNNRSYYLYTNSAYWTMSPYNYGGDANVFYVYSAGYLNGINYVAIAYGVRPVINLRGDLFVTGTGTSTDPYEVSLPVVPITIFNGTELTNIYYNGTEISKMYCNGVLVFEKGPAIYKRRIMVGDNLRNKNIFLENYPENLYDLMYQDGMDGSTTLIDINNEYTIHQNISVEGVYPNYTVLYGYIDTWPLAADEMNTEIYFFDKRETPTTYEIYSPILVKNDINYLVTKCYDRVGYRVLYIEDPKIRPLQVGDKIVAGTKFYFNFPDDFNEVLSTASNTGEFIKTKEKNPDYDTLYLKIESSSYEVCFQSNYGTINDIYWYRDGQLDTNISTFTASTSNILDFGYNYATVSFIDENNIAYPYVLVDITTLG